MQSDLVAGLARVADESRITMVVDFAPELSGTARAALAAAVAKRVIVESRRHLRMKNPIIQLVNEETDLNVRRTMMPALGELLAFTTGERAEAKELHQAGQLPELSNEDPTYRQWGLETLREHLKSTYPQTLRDEAARQLLTHDFKDPEAVLVAPVSAEHVRHAMKVILEDPTRGDDLTFLRELQIPQANRRAIVDAMIQHHPRGPLDGAYELGHSLADLFGLAPESQEHHELLARLSPGWVFTRPDPHNPTTADIYRSALDSHDPDARVAAIKLLVNSEFFNPEQDHPRLETALRELRLTAESPHLKTLLYALLPILPHSAELERITLLWLQVRPIAHWKFCIRILRVAARPSLSAALSALALETDNASLMQTVVHTLAVSAGEDGIRALEALLASKDRILLTDDRDSRISLHSEVTQALSDIFQREAPETLPFPPANPPRHLSEELLKQARRFARMRSAAQNDTLFDWLSTNRRFDWSAELAWILAEIGDPSILPSLEMLDESSFDTPFVHWAIRGAVRHLRDIAASPSNPVRYPNNPAHAA